MTIRPVHTSADHLRLAEWQPRARTIAPRSQVERPAVSCIDVHDHLGRWLTNDQSCAVPDVAALVDELETHDVETVVNLDGRWGDELVENPERYDRRYPHRFVTFGHLDWRALAADRPTTELVGQVDALARAGARGVKVWKDLGEQPDWWFGDEGTPTFHRLMQSLETQVESTQVLFGTDLYPPSADAYRLAFRFVESADEAIDYSPDAPVPPQGRCEISAAHLPPEVLPAFYAGNARRVLGLARPQ